MYHLFSFNIHRSICLTHLKYATKGPVLPGLKTEATAYFELLHLLYQWLVQIIFMSPEISHISLQNICCYQEEQRTKTGSLRDSCSRNKPLYRFHMNHKRAISASESQIITISDGNRAIQLYFTFFFFLVACFWLATYQANLIFLLIFFNFKG